MQICHKSYSNIITLENLFQAWGEFAKGKRRKTDVGVFERSLEDNLFSLYKSLQDKTYKHGNYEAFYIHDPKIREEFEKLMKYFFKEIYGQEE